VAIWAQIPCSKPRGTGAFPGQDIYTQPPAGGFVGSRGDANVISVGFQGPGGAGAQNVAETRLNAGSIGGASGNNLISTSIIINIATGQTQQLTFSFTGDNFLQVARTQQSETAFAQVAMSVSLTLGGGQAFLWVPDLNTGNDFGVATQTNPYALN
jgi:hypothetical protein